jgi:hypothetical protein
MQRCCAPSAGAHCDALAAAPLPRALVVRVDSALELKRRLTERAHTAAAAELRVAAVLVHGGGGDDRQTLASARAEFARVAQAFEHGARFYECVCYPRAFRVLSACYTRAIRVLYRVLYACYTRSLRVP